MSWSTTPYSRPRLTERRERLNVSERLIDGTSATLTEGDGHHKIDQWS